MASRNRTPIRFVAIATVPPTGVAAFQRYEAAVLPLLGDHGGSLMSRWRSTDELREVHVLAFESEDAFAAYGRDPRRASFAYELTASGATVEVFRATDVTT